MGATFPKNFIWGVATAAYQIEGAAAEDGRGPSIWDTFSHTPGKTLNGDTGDVACDHYHRWPEDLRIMRELGVSAYRLSVAWPRIVPQGVGAVNQAGLDWYDRLIDALLEAGITPFVTLYHWDLPQALQDQGGWAVRSTAEAFEPYTRAVAGRLGDRVKHWITHNEPWVVAFTGNFIGRHAPGLKDFKTAVQISHHLLLSHGLARRALREEVPGAQVGITLNLAPASPATDSEADQRAAQLHDGFHNRWFLDPVFGRGYPADILELYGDLAPHVEPGDLEIIGQPLDFLGANYYFPARVRHNPDDQPLGFSSWVREDWAAAGYEITEMGWPVEPDGLRELLVRLQRDYNPPAVYVTENGVAFDDQLVDGQVDDQRRIAFLQEHFQAAAEGLAAGAALKGYFVWSLLDNFEWGWGYSKRFGLVYVDYQTQQRIVKGSGRWYQRVIREGLEAGD